jgi:hypothetical protein
MTAIGPGSNFPIGPSGGGGGAGDSITLSSSTVPSTAAVGTTIGTLSVVGGTGIYTFTLTPPSSLFSISGDLLQVAAALTPGSDPIAVHADNGAGSTFTQPFLITVTHVGVAPSLKFNLASNSQYLAVV